MGAHPWKLFTSWDPDAEVVLARAREHAFAVRDYGKFWARGQPHAASMAELIRLCGEEGTCSIIDVERIAQNRAPGSAAPLSRDELIDLYGTMTPTHSQVDAVDAIFDLLDRGEAAFTTVYEDGRPREIFFAGYSFD